MTAACGGGTSTAKSTTPAIAILSSVTLQALAEAALGTASPWVAIFVAALSYTIDTSGYCSNDPPAWPTFTATDALEFVTLGPAAPPATLAKVGDAILNLAWPALCECSSGPVTGLPSPTTYPSGGPAAPQPGSPSVPYQPNTPCLSFTSTNHWSYTSSSAFNFEIYSASDSTPTDPFGEHFITGMIWHVGNQATSGAGVQIRFQVYCLDAADTILQTLSGPVFSDGDNVDWPLQFAPGTDHIEIHPQTIIGSGTSQLIDPATGSVGYSVDWFCNNTNPTTATAPCCPPDPNIQTALNQIQQMLAFIYSNLPVRVPNYVAGTAHTGLTGNGSVTLASTCIAAQVSITTLPAVYTQVAGTPNTYLDVGWLTPVTAEGPERGIRVTRSLEAIPLPEATVSVDYTLPPGEIITITELQAG